MMEFRIAKAARVTGEMLERLVREKLTVDAIAEPDCVICYGVGYTGPKPALNKECSGKDKREQGVTLMGALEGEALEILDRPLTSAPLEPHLPVVARKVHHSKGRDMRVCRTVAGVRTVLRKARHDFFTPIVESDTEYRVWVYRKRVLSVYEKRLTEPEKNVKFGRNRANGWTFHALDTENIPESVRRVAIAAVRCLNLDFGAVDILGKWNEAHTDVHATVLEVNSAPGVSDEHRSGIVKITHRIVRWIANGCPQRKDNEELQ
jgi:hypothetical protein